MPGTVRRLAAATTAALVLVLCGCSGGSAPDGATTDGDSASVSATPDGDSSTTEAGAPPVSAPEVGQCWSTTPALAEAFAWTGTPAVDCAQPHNAVTFALTTLPDDIDYAKAEARNRLWAVGDVMHACSYVNAMKYVGHTLDTPLRINTFVYPPTAAEFEAGARWVRCDLGVPTAGRARLPATGFLELPADLAGAITADIDAFSYCSTGSRSTGPYAKQARIGACNKRSTWRMTHQVDQAALDPDAAFPGEAATKEKTYRDCQRESGVSWVVWPLAKGWRDGSTRSICWTSPAQLSPS